MDRRRVDRLHLHPLHPAAGSAGQQPRHLQLRAGCGRRRAALRRRLLVPLGQELVQGTEGPGHAGGAGRDRGGAGGGWDSGSSWSDPIEKPKIGITVSPKRGEQYYRPYVRAVEAAGAEPVELPPGTSSLPDLDGLLLPGGWDVDPAFYGEKKDEKV